MMQSRDGAHESGSSLSSNGNTTGSVSVAGRSFATLLAKPKSRARRFMARGVILGTGVLLAATLLLGWLVQRSMRELTGSSIEAVLRANAASVTLWLEQRQSDAKRITSHESVRSIAIELLADVESSVRGRGDRNQQSLAGDQRSANSAASLSTGSLVRQFGDDVDRRVAGDAYLGWVLLSESSEVVASSFPALVGTIMPLSSDLKPRLERSQATVCRPFKSPKALTSEGPLSRAEAPIMMAIAPVNQGARLVGSLGLLIDPRESFDAILQAGRWGESGESYAFDRDGLLLSKSRFQDELRAGGLLQEDDQSGSALNVRVRDPGVDIRKCRVLAADLEDAPLTLMADQATRGATGFTVASYRGYRGVPVIGSWQWIPEYELGIAAEMDYAEAFAPMQIMRRAFYGVIGFISLLGVATLLGLSIMRWRSRGRSTQARKLGQYDLGSVIAKGGMGMVYRGRHAQLRRDVAIKVLEPSEVTPRSLKRFEREVRMTARLRHPNTIGIYDYGHSEDGTFYYVMEYVDGFSLQQLVQQYGRQPAERVIYLLLQVCGSLSEAHQQSLVHRDVKPANILVTCGAGLYDMIKVLDFGLVKEFRGEETQLTQSSAITGTPLYMSPESVRDASQSVPQSDIYSVGAVGYFLLTGVPTFEGDCAADVCIKQLHQQPVRCDQRIGQTLPDDLQNVLMSCLRKDPAERPQSMHHLAEALLQCQNAHAWAAADACQWWEQVYEGPRDESADFADTEGAANHVSARTPGDSGGIDSSKNASSYPIAGEISRHATSARVAQRSGRQPEGTMNEAPDRESKMTPNPSNPGSTTQ